MNELSRHSSRQPSLVNDATSLTSFPDPSSSALSPENESSSLPLQGLLETAGPSMFDESSPLDANDPQTLSTAPTDVLRNIVDHHGAVELIRCLSTMLAERDAHITALTRLTEEYKIPRQHVTEAASRVKQAERRRLSLAAASEDLATSSGIGSESGVCFSKT